MRPYGKSLSRVFLALTLVAAIAPAAFADDPQGAKQGYLGIRMQRIDEGLAEALDMKADGGVLIGQVIEGGPAAKAGLEQGDIVVKVGGKPVGTPGEMRAVIREHSTGEEVKIDVIRDGKPRTISVTLGEAEKETAMFAPPGPREPRAFWVEKGNVGRDRGYLGVMTQPLSQELGEFFGVPGSEGALVSEVIDESPAAKLGLRAGDVITRIDGEKVDGPSGLARLVRQIDEQKEITVEWVRDRRTATGKVAIELRAGGGPGSDAWRKHGEFRGMPRRFERRAAPAPGMSELDEENLREDLEALRNELEAMRTEMRKMQESAK